MRPDRFRRLRTVLSRRQPDLTVLMERVNKPHNFAAILRNCDAVGVMEAHVVPPKHGLDFHPAAAGGTRKWIDVTTHPSVEPAVALLKARGFRILAAHPSESATDFRAVDYTRPTALLMGAELYGVSDTGLDLADEHLTIPMMGMVHSLNVSVATALLLYEAQKQRFAAGMYDECRLDPAAFQRILFRWTHPVLARHLDALGTPYPTLDDHGDPMF